MQVINKYKLFVANLLIIVYLNSEAASYLVAIFRKRLYIFIAVW